jgi:hypothetical protein
VTVVAFLICRQTGRYGHLLNFSSSKNSKFFVIWQSADRRFASIPLKTAFFHRVR